jgi:hypothetical protein
MRYHWVQLIVMVATITLASFDSVVGQEAPVNRIKVASEPVSLADSQLMEQLENGVRAKWHVAFESHRKLVQSYLDLRFEELYRLNKDDGQTIKQATFQRLRLASKGAIDAYFQATLVPKQRWFDEQTKAVFKTMKSQSLTAEKTIEKHLNFSSHFSHDVDSILLLVGKIEKSPRLAKSLNAALTDKQVAKLAQRRIDRATGVQRAYLEFIVSTADLAMLLSPPQRVAFAELIEKHRKRITMSTLGDDESGWEEAITAFTAIPKAELRKILTEQQVRACHAFLSNWGVDFSFEEESTSDPVALQLVEFTTYAKEFSTSLFKTMARKIPAQQQVKQAQERATRIQQQRMTPIIEHTILFARMSAAQQREFRNSAQLAIEKQVEGEFEPLRERYAEREVDKLKQRINSPELDTEKGNNSNPDLAKPDDGPADVELGEVDFSGLESLLDPDDPLTAVLALTKSDEWKKMLSKSLTIKQQDRLRKDKFKRYIRPRDAYLKLMVLWLDRALYLTPQKLRQMLELAQRNATPITPKDVEEVEPEEVWSRAITGLSRIPRSELKKILEPSQFVIWTTAMTEFGGEAELEEEVVIEEIEEEIEEAVEGQFNDVRQALE